MFIKVSDAAEGGRPVRILIENVPFALRNEDPAVFPILIALLRTDDSHSQMVAAHLLSNFGVQTKMAIPALQDAAMSDDKLVRIAALEALGAIAPEGAAKGKYK